MTMSGASPKNVGAIASYLNKLITNPRYNRLQKDFERWLRRMLQRRDRLDAGHKAKKRSKAQSRKSRYKNPTIRNPWPRGLGAA